MRLLLENGAQVNAVGSERSTLQEAVFCGNKPVVRLLLEHGAAPKLIYMDQTVVHFKQQNIMAMSLFDCSGVRPSQVNFDGDKWWKWASSRLRST
jgi:ankyrin repeat protein